MEYLKTDIWNNITAYPHCCIGEGIHSVCVYIEDGKKVIGVPRKAIYNRLGLNINNGSYDTFTLDMDINYEKAHNNHVGNDIVIKDEETKKALLQLGQTYMIFKRDSSLCFSRTGQIPLMPLRKQTIKVFRTIVTRIIKNSDAVLRKMIIRIAMFCQA